MTLSPSFWKVSETKISDKVSHVTPLSELNEMVQYISKRVISNPACNVHEASFLVVPQISTRLGIEARSYSFKGF